MTEGMIQAGVKLMNAALEYGKLYEESHGHKPVVYLEVTDEGHELYGHCVFISNNHFNTDLIKDHIKAVEETV